MEMVETETATIETRDSGGRWKPGCSGNPAGKKPGTVHAVTLLKRALREGDAEAAAQQMAQKAAEGNLSAIRFVLDRLDPKPRGRLIAFVVDDPDDVAQLLQAAQRAVVTGGISVDEGMALLRFIEACDRLRGWAETTAAREATRAAVAPGAGPRPESPAFGLQSTAAGEPADAADPALRPLNRHERRRAAAVQRGALRLAAQT